MVSKMAFLICSLFLLFLVTNGEFSGFYTPNLTYTAEDFAASWLVAKSRFLQTRRGFMQKTNMAGVSFGAVRERCKNCKTLMARDYFDFLVEHLSSTTNSVPFHPFIFQDLTNRLKETSKGLKEIALGNIITEERLNKTIGVLVFSTNAFSHFSRAGNIKNRHERIRRQFFEATFWSIYRHVRHIVVYVANEQDKSEIFDMGLPFWSIQQVQVPVASDNKTVLLPRKSVETTLNFMEPGGHPDWQKFEYVYFTEGDQILHWRDPEQMFNAMDFSNGTFVLVPHRMQTLAVSKGFPRKLRARFPKNHFLLIPNASIVTHDLTFRTGSCCDDGRYRVAPCGGWWYACSKFGLKDINPWFQFGPSGFTMPKTTAHQAACTYYPEKTLCPVAENCRFRVPVRGADGSPAKAGDVCKEMQRLHGLGPMDLLKIHFNLVGERDNMQLAVEDKIEDMDDESKDPRNGGK